MCIFFKRKKKDKGSVNAGSGSQTQTQTTGEHASQGKEKPKLQQEKRNGINEVHRKIKNSADVTIEEQKYQMAKAQKALGLCPNTALIERIAERDKLIEKTQDKSLTKSVMSAKGDISFSFSKRKKLSKDDDTVAPDFGCNTPNPVEEELLEEDQADDIPNSENYMYNRKEIVYTCHAMIRSAGKLDITDVVATEDVKLSDAQENAKWDPYAPLKELQTRDMFNCATLRQNTLISNTLAMPSDTEKAKFDKKQQTTQEGNHKKNKKVVINLPALDLSEFNDLTVVSQTQSISTKRAASIGSGKSKKEKISTVTTQEKIQPKSNAVKSKESYKTGGKSAERKLSAPKKK
uniref:Uncharacterized protein n=1 Tax=Panagrolaimus sp. PS1159 TaxID=55785 RepID=A0AC35G9J6_9BILA